MFGGDFGGKLSIGESISIHEASTLTSWSGLYGPVLWLIFFNLAARPRSWKETLTRARKFEPRSLKHRSNFLGLVAVSANQSPWRHSLVQSGVLVQGFGKGGGKQRPPLKVGHCAR